MYVPFLFEKRSQEAHDESEANVLYNLHETRTRDASILVCSMNQLRPELDIVLQCLSLNGYSVLSLIDDILARHNREDERIKILREGMERDAAEICTRLLPSGPGGVLKYGGVQCMCSRFLVLVGAVARNETELTLACLVSHTVPIDRLPDNVFLDIFNFCLEDHTEFPVTHARSWKPLVHVCQRWRGIIFASPRRLDLHLNCSYGTPVRKNLVFWPVTIPLIINYPSVLTGILARISPEDEDNIVAALEHPSRIHRIIIHAAAPQIRKVSTALQKSFPALAHLELACYVYPTDSPVILRRCLGGSAPHLQHLSLKYISCPQLSTLLSSARGLVTLNLDQIPPNGYMSPEAIVTSLAVLTKLTSLYIAFYEETSPPNQWRSHPDPPMRTILPALTRFGYTGCSEYLEDLFVRIDTPRVNFVLIAYSTRQIQATQLLRFLERTENLKIDRFTRMETSFNPEESYIELNCPREKCSLAPHSLIIIWDQQPLEMQVQGMADFLGQLTAAFSKVDDLFIRGGDYALDSGMDIDEWMPLFRLFPAVETLRLSGEMAVYITSALDDTAEDMVTDVLPALRLICLAEHEDEAKDMYEEDEDENDWKQQVGSMDRFLSLRQLSGCPVTIFSPS
jgi:hypothetical protein